MAFTSAASRGYWAGMHHARRELVTKAGTVFNPRISNVFKTSTPRSFGSVAGSSSGNHQYKKEEQGLKPRFVFHNFNDIELSYGAVLDRQLGDNIEEIASRDTPPSEKENAISTIRLHNMMHEIRGHRIHDYINVIHELHKEEMELHNDQHKYYQNQLSELKKLAFDPDIQREYESLIEDLIKQNLQEEIELSKKYKMVISSLEDLMKREKDLIISGNVEKAVDLATSLPSYLMDGVTLVMPTVIATKVLFPLDVASKSLRSVFTAHAKDLAKTQEGKVSEDEMLLEFETTGRVKDALLDIAKDFIMAKTIEKGVKVATGALPSAGVQKGVEKGMVFLLSHLNSKKLTVLEARQTLNKACEFQVSSMVCRSFGEMSRNEGEERALKDQDFGNYKKERIEQSKKEFNLEKVIVTRIVENAKQLDRLAREKRG